MKTCPKCRKRIDVRAVRCPYCHTDFDGMAIADGKREHRREGWLTALGVAVAIGAAIYWIAQPENISAIAQWEGEQAARRSE